MTLFCVEKKKTKLYWHLSDEFTKLVRKKEQQINYLNVN